MNIIDAITSGKEFRRRGWDDDGVYLNHPEKDDLAFTSGGRLLHDRKKYRPRIQFFAKPANCIRLNK